MREKKGKYLWTLLVILLMVFSLLLGACAQEPSTPADSGDEMSDESADAETEAEEVEEEVQEITVLYLDDPPFWKEQADRFTEETGVVVNWVGVPFGQLHDKILTAFAGGDAAYDVIHVRDDYVAEFGSRGFLMPLDDMISGEYRATMPENAWDNLTWDGVQYGVPRYFWMWQFYYNTDIVDEPPATWDELAAMAEELTIDTDNDGEIDQWGYCAAWGENLAFHPFQIHLLAAGGEMLDENNQPAFNSEAGRRALQWMVDMAATDNVCPAAYELMHSGSLAELFVQGNIAMIANSTQTFRLASDPETSRVVDKVSAAIAPGDVEPSATFSETGGLAIPASSANPDLAFQYIQFVTSAMEQKQMAMELSSIPTVTEALTDPEVQAEYPHFQYVQEQMEHPFGMIKHPNAAEIDRTMAIHIISALRGEETVEEALDNAEQEILSIIQ